MVQACALIRLAGALLLCSSCSSIGLCIGVAKFVIVVTSSNERNSKEEIVVVLVYFKEVVAVFVYFKEIEVVLVYFKGSACSYGAL